MVSISALVCHSVQFNSLIDLIRQIKTVKEFTREVRILMEYGVLPRIDMLRPRDVYEITIAMKIH